MAGMSKRIKERIDIIEREGVAVLEEGQTNGCHTYFVCRYRGVVHRFITPGSPSDGHRGQLQFRGDIRRWKREIDRQ